MILSGREPLECRSHPAIRECPRDANVTLSVATDFGPFCPELALAHMKPMPGRIFAVTWKTSPVVAEACTLGELRATDQSSGTTLLRRVLAGIRHLPQPDDPPAVPLHQGGSRP